RLQPCALTSRKLTNNDRGWAIWEKEAYAVRWALATWRHFLEGAKENFEVWTDHKNLEALQTPRRLAPKHVRWALYFQCFKFRLKYVPGGRNFLVDALSRKPQYHSKREEVVQALIPPTVQSRDKILVVRSVEDMVQTLQGALKVDPWLTSHPHTLTMTDRLAWKGEKLYVPQSLRVKILRQGHDVKSAGHFGFLKTLHLLKRQFWWPGMKTDVQKYVRECSMCATTKPQVGKPSGLLQQVSNPNHPWEEIGMDFIVDLPASHGNTVIWTVMDLFSKQAHFIPCKGLPSARCLAKLFVIHVYRLHGVPRRIISEECNSPPNSGKISSRLLVHLRD
ncbi:hypothetical protein NXF25_018732, partial [Crotalus adamanteus]